MMKKRILLPILLLVFFQMASAQLIINEVSQGTSGSQEYVELLVLGDGNPNCNNECIDLRGWILDDNNGWHAAGSGTGIAQGVMRFADHPQWECVKIGAMIVVYNENDKNPVIPADDETDADGNCVYIIPASSLLFERNPSLPIVNGSDSYDGLTYNPGGQWSATGMSNSNDSYHTVAPYDLTVPHHAVSWGNNTLNNIIYFSGSASGSVMYMTNATDNDPYLQSNWTQTDASTDQTPGTGNNPTNTAWIAMLNNNCTPHAPAADAGDDATTCGAAIPLTATGGISYEWSTGDNTAGISVLPTGVATYTVTVTDAAGCTATDEVVVTEGNVPTAVINASDTQLTCDVTSILLDASASGGIGCQWNTGEIGFTILVGSPGDYIVTVVDAGSGCTASTTITVTENTIPPIANISPSAPQLDCGTTSIDLEASGGDIYEWSDGSTSQNLTITTADTYTVTITNSMNGCTSTADIDIDQDPSVPIAEITPSALELDCNTTSIDLDAGAGFDSYAWSDGSAGQSLTVTAEGAYTVTVTSGACSSEDEVIIGGNAIITPSLTGNTNICEGENTTLALDSTYDTYEWQDGSAAATLTVNTGGVYTVTVTLGACNATASMAVNASPLPNPSISGEADICEGENTTLTASTGFASYLWSDGGTGQSLTANTGGEYSVTVTDANGCEGSTSFTVNATALSLSVNGDIALCGGDSTLLIAESEGTVEWFDASGSPLGSGDSLAVTPTQSSTAIIATSTLGDCSLNETIILTLTSPTLEVDAPATICEGESATLNATATPAGGTFIWMDGNGDVVETGASLTISPAATTDYTPTYTANGCEVSGNTGVQVISFATLGITALPGNSIAAGEQVVLDVTGAIPAGAEFSWTADVGEAPVGSGTVTVSPTETTTYTVTISSPEGCMGIAMITIEVLDTGLDIPNVFTPNGDDENDGFYPIFNAGSVEILEFKIFDRWGEVVHDNPAEAWDGRFQNKPLPSDIYVYLLRVRHLDGTEEQRAGDVALMR